MIKLEMKTYNMILTEKQQKYQHYHPEKLININFLLVKKWVIEQAMFTYSPLGKAFEKNWRSRQKANRIT